MIDAHVHLWLSQRGEVNGLPVYDLGEGRSQFGSEVRQMMPPYMTDGVNSAERLLANMNFSQIGGAVVTQEYIDGPQDEYLRDVRRAWPDRFRVCALYMEKGLPCTSGMDGIKLCGGRMKDQDLTHHEEVFRLADEQDMFIAIDMADGDAQTGSLREMAQQFPKLRIAIGHFGMVTVPGWEEQIRLARLPNVYVESGGHHLAVQQRVLPLSLGGAGDPGGQGHLRHGQADVGLGLPPHHDGYHLPHELGLRGEIPPDDRCGKAPVPPRKRPRLLPLR